MKNIIIIGTVMQQQGIVDSLFYLTLAVSLIAITLGGMTFVRQAMPVRTALLDNVVVRWVIADPMFLFIITLIFILYVFSSRLESQHKFLWVCAGGVIAALFLLFEYLVLEIRVLKPALSYLRPDGALQLGNGPVTQWMADLLSRLFRLTPSLDTGAVPSGFVLRQTIASLTLLILAWGRTASRRRYYFEGAVFTFLSLIFLVWCVYSRVYSRMHYFVDCTIAIAIGINMFWPCQFIFDLIYLKISRINTKGIKAGHILKRAATLWPFSLVLMLILFLLSGESHMWVFFMPGYLAIVSMVFLFALRIAEEGE